MRDEFLDLFFPRFCLGCGYIGTYLCPSCQSKMKKIKKAHCFYCEKPSLFGLTHPGCKQQKGIDGYLSLYLYEGLFKKLLHESKYKGAYEVLHGLLKFFQNRLFQDLNKWSSLFQPKIVAIPLHPQRVRERGFNQSEIITSHYFTHLNFTSAELLKRTINTTHLANIEDKNIRKKIIRGAFTFIENSFPDAVLLVDDVVTSGSTILECSKTLKDNGVQTVLAFSLAKG